jgi:hypothetical protein
VSSAYLGAYWGPRPDTVPDVAARVRQTLDAVERATGRSAWFLPADSEAAARTQPVRGEDVARLLAESAVDGAVVGSGAWLQVSLWDGEHVGVSVRAGMATPVVPNAVVVQAVPSDGAPGPEWVDVLRAVVAAWQPDWATLSSTELRDAQGPDLDPVVAGWATYLGPGRPAPAALPPGVVTEACGPGRLLRFADPSAVDDDAVRSLRRALRRPPGGHRHEAVVASPVAARRSRQRGAVVRSIAVFAGAAGLVLRVGGGVVTTAVLVALAAVALGYPFVVNLRRPRVRPVGQQGWRTLVAYGEMAAASSALPPVRGRPRSTSEAFGRLSVSPAGWRWDPDPRSARIGFGPIELPPTWQVVGQGRSRSGVFTSHVTLGCDDDPRTVTFWCTATTASEVVGVETS